MIRVGAAMRANAGRKIGPVAHGDKGVLNRLGGAILHDGLQLVGYFGFGLRRGGGDHSGHQFLRDGGRSLRVGQLDHAVAGGAGVGIIGGGAGIDQDQAAERGGVLPLVCKGDVSTHGESAEHAREGVNLREEDVQILGQSLQGEASASDGLSETAQVGGDDPADRGEVVNLACARRDDPAETRGEARRARLCRIRGSRDWCG